MPISMCSAMRRQALWPVLIISAVIAGCSNNPPVAALSGADMAVKQAMNAKALEYAPADLQRAMDKSARAKQAVGEDNYRRESETPNGGSRSGTHQYGRVGRGLSGGFQLYARRTLAESPGGDLSTHGGAAPLSSVCVGFGCAG